ncbi:MAG: hypothetical protein Q6K80_11870 [Thermostichus sp. DG_1_6_bins_120]
MRDFGTQTRSSLRRLGLILAEIFEETKPRLQEWDRRLTDWVRRRRMGVDPALPKVAIYVVTAVVVLVIPILTLAVLVALIAFFTLQISTKWSRWQKSDPYLRSERRYLRRAAEEQEYEDETLN